MMHIGESKLMDHPKLKLSSRKRRVKSVCKNVKQEVKQSQTVRTYIFNFFLCATIGCLFPYLPIFFKLLGLSPLQNGILTAVRGIGGIWASPIMGTFRHLPVFTNAAVFVCTVGFIIDTFSLALVQDGFRGTLPSNRSLCNVEIPLPISNRSVNITNLRHAHHKKVINLLELEKGYTKLRRTLKSESNQNLDTFVGSRISLRHDETGHRFTRSLRDGVKDAEPFHPKKRHGKRKMPRHRLRHHRQKHHKRLRLTHRKLHGRRHQKGHRRPHHHKKHRILKSRKLSQTRHGHRNASSRILKGSRKKKTFTEKPQTSDTNLPSWGPGATLPASPPSVTLKQRSSSLPVKHVPTTPVTDLRISSRLSVPFEGTSNSSKGKDNGKVKTFLMNAKEAVLKAFPLPKVFMSCLVITVISELFYSVLSHKSDLVDEVGRYFCPSIFAVNRLWGKIGYCFTAFLSCYISWRLTCSYTSSSTFYFHFYGFLAVGGIVLFATLCLPIKRKPRRSFCEDWCRPWKLVLCNLQATFFSASLVVVGTIDFVIDAYLLWYIHELRGTELILGVMVTIAIITDILFYCFIGISIQWIGHAGLLTVSILLSGAQFIGLSYIYNAWLLIPFQVLRGIATAASKSALFDFSNSVSPLGKENAVHSLLNSIYAGLGVGIGGIYLSFAYVLYGPVMLFSGMSAFCFVYGTLYSLISLLHFTVSHGRKSSTQNYEKIQPDVVPENDWLVEALEDVERRSEENSS